MEAVRSALVPANFFYARKKRPTIAERVKRFHINLLNERRSIVRAPQRSLFDPRSSRSASFCKCHYAVRKRPSQSLNAGQPRMEPINAVPVHLRET
jgi:hypothetical protein